MSEDSQANVDRLIAEVFGRTGGEPVAGAQRTPPGPMTVDEASDIVVAAVFGRVPDRALVDEAYAVLAPRPPGSERDSTRSISDDAGAPVSEADLDKIIAGVFGRTVKEA